MRQLFYIVVFWIVVVVTTRLATYFPDSLLARVLFMQFGPVPVRGESKADYLLRCARFAGSWFVQALLLWIVGWMVLRWQATLADSLYFLALWAVVIPLLGGVAFLVSLCALCRCLWIRLGEGALNTRTRG